MAKPPGSRRGQPPQREQQPQAQYQIMGKLTQGPIPSSDELYRYEQLLPGAADRILSMAERNQQRRHDSESFADKSNRIMAVANARAVDANIRASDASTVEARRGQWMAFTIAVLFLVAAVGLALAGKEIVSSVLGGGVLVALVAAFLRKPSK